MRASFAAFADGHEAPAGPNRPGPRDISNALFFSESQPRNDRDMSSLVFAWAQVRAQWGPVSCRRPRITLKANTWVV
jgi:hypothetical protein